MGAMLATPSRRPRSGTLPSVDVDPLGPAPRIYAHRGDRSRAADNTLEAFALAVDAGAHGIELDVRRTADGVLVLHHDPAADGGPPFSTLAFADVRSTNPSIPTLEEALRAIPGHVAVNVEIKNAVHQPDFDASRSIVEQALAVVERVDDPRRILLSSFDPDAVRATPARVGVRRGLLITDGVPLDAAVQLAVELGAVAIHPPMSTVAGDPEGAVRRAGRSGLATVVWDVHTDDEVGALADAGAAVIIVDDPAMALSVVEGRSR